MCPISLALDLFGDKWTLLILRDLLFKQATSFKEFQAAGEGIASNVLSDRLHRLEDGGLITRSQRRHDARMVTYSPTAKALDLLPTLMEIVIWSARYLETAAPPEIVERMVKQPDEFIDEIVSRFTPGDQPRVVVPKKRRPTIKRKLRK